MIYSFQIFDGQVFKTPKFIGKVDSVNNFCGTCSVKILKTFDKEFKEGSYYGFDQVYFLPYLEKKNKTKMIILNQDEIEVILNLLKNDTTQTELYDKLNK